MVSLNGLPVFVTPDPEPRQVRFPRSKRRRIRAKWTARNENWAAGHQLIPDDQVIKSPLGLFVNPRMFERLRQAAEQDHRAMRNFW